MAKPILVIRFPLNAWNNIDDNEKLVKNCSLATGYEYHILICPDQLIESTQFEVHNANNLQPVDLKDLEERLTILINGANELLTYQKDEEKELEKRLTEIQMQRFKNMYGK